jgi:hypothetical protein
MSILLFYRTASTPTPPSTGVNYMLLLALTSGYVGDTAPVSSAPNVYVNRMVRVSAGKYTPMDWWVIPGATSKPQRGVFQFSEGVRRSARAKANSKAQDYKPGVEKEEEPQPIQGITPGSVQEWRVARALDRLKLEYDYQKGIGGGRRVRGGQVVDFWVYTAPYPTPIFVQGEYWHNRKTEMADTLKFERVQRIYKGQVMPNVILRESDLETMDAAYQTVRRRLIG